MLTFCVDWRHLNTAVRRFYDSPFMSVETISSWDGAIMDFSEGPKVVKYNFTHSKLQKQLFYRKVTMKKSNFKI